MTDWIRCPVTRAMLTIFKGRDKCPHPEDCQFWDREVEGCGVRLMSESAMGEFIIEELNRLGQSDWRISDELGVTKATISKWRHGRVKVPKRRMAQLKRLLRCFKKKGAMDEDIVENRAHRKAGMAAEVRRMLNFLGNHGWNGSRVADFIGVSRCSVSKWRSGIAMPIDRNFEALVEKHGEVEAECKRESQSNN